MEAQELGNIHWVENGSQKDSCSQQSIEFAQNKIIRKWGEKREGKKKGNKQVEKNEFRRQVNGRDRWDMCLLLV